jgi:hypothetical membrane protein
VVTRRAGAVCGIAGPVAFVSAWLVGGLLTDGYDPVEQAISQLARQGASTQPLMTAGLVAFGVLLPVWALPLGRELRSGAVRAAVVTAGVTTLAVAALPLTREPGGTQDLLHAVAAGTGYVAMALTPLLAVGALRRQGRTGVAAASAAVGLVSAGCLVGTVLLPDVSGGLQRLGLGVVDAWHVVAACAVLRRRG